MRNLTGTGFFISSKIGKAIKDYNLIEDGDKLLVAVSGGKDSLSLLKMLLERKKWAPVRFDIVAAHIETDFRRGSHMHKKILTGLFKKMGTKYVFKKINVLDKNKKTGCFWCSRTRRKALFEMAGAKGCNKIVFGHHKDDIIETTLLNLFFQGEFSTMNPRQELFKGAITIIRPLCYVEERVIRKFAKENGFPEEMCKCPYSQDSNRKYLKEFIKRIEKRSPNVRTNIFRSVARIKQEYIDLKKE